MEFQPVLMAAGQGSRMRDLTSKCPKALLPIGNMPMMFYPIKMLKDAGFDGMVTVFKCRHSLGCPGPDKQKMVMKSV